MKVIFNSVEFPTQVKKDIEYNIIARTIFSGALKFVANIDNIDIFRNTNKENGKPLLVLIDHLEVCDTRVIEFDTLIEMFHFIDGISIFKKY